MRSTGVGPSVSVQEMSKSSFQIFSAPAFCDLFRMEVQNSDSSVNVISVVCRI